MSRPLRVSAHVWDSPDQRLLAEGLPLAGCEMVPMEEADVVFCGGMGNAIVEGFKALGLGRPLVNLVLDIPVDRTVPQHPKYELYRRWREALERSTLRVSISEHTRSVLKKVWGLDSVICRVPIDGAAAAQVNQIPWHERPRLIVGVGRLVAEKEWLLLFDALLHGVTEATCIIGGHGSPDQAAILRAVAAKYRLPATVISPLPGTIKWALFGLARVVAAPSSYEGLGLVPIEGYAAGALPLVSDIPAHREVWGEYYQGMVHDAQGLVWASVLDRSLNYNEQAYEAVRASAALSLGDYLHPEPSRKLAGLLAGVVGR